MRWLCALLLMAGAVQADTVPPRQLLEMALSLYDRGERTEADALLADWVAVMPQTAPLPDGFQDLEADPDLLVAILLQHLDRGDRKSLPVLQYWLDRDRMVGWRVFAALSDHYRGGPGLPIFAGLRIGPEVATRLPLARLENRAAAGR